MAGGWIESKGRNPGFFLGDLSSVTLEQQGYTLIFSAGSEQWEVRLADNCPPRDQFIVGNRYLVMIENNKLAAIFSFPTHEIVWPVAGGSLA